MSVMPSMLMEGPTRSANPSAGAAVPLGLQLSTGKLMLPHKRMPYGTACQLVCPHCHEAGRGEAAALVHHPGGRVLKNGERKDDHFQHMWGCAPKDPKLPCYRRSYARGKQIYVGGGGGPETVEHRVGAEFIGWWLDGREGWCWRDEGGSAGRYPGSSWVFDGLLTKGTQKLALEVEVTHRIEPEKTKFLKKADCAVLVVDISHPEMREWVKPKLQDWDMLTMRGELEEAIPLADEIYTYLMRNNAFQPMENDYYVKNKNA